MTDFKPVEALRIGNIVEVAGTSIRVELSGEVSELTRSYDGRIYPIGQIGSIVKIHFGRKLIFGFVTLLRMRSEDLIEHGTAVPPDSDQRIMEVELFAEGVWDMPKGRLNFSRGVSTYPLPQQGAYLLTREEATGLFQSAEGDRPDDGNNPLVPFGHYVGTEAAPCRANIDKMFGMHCAVLGSTGSGKSGAVAALLHSVLEHKANGEDSLKPNIIIIDPHGEYGAGFEEQAVVYRAYDPIGSEGVEGAPIKLPYWLMSADEFRHLVIGKTEQEATSQNNIIYKAVTHARMVAAGLAIPAPDDYGSPAPEGGRSHDESQPVDGVDEAKLLEFDRDKPRPFCLVEFERHIRYLQAGRVQGSQVNKVADSEFNQKFKSLLDKLSVLRRDPRIHFLMGNWDLESPSLSSVINQLVGQPGSGQADDNKIKILDISGLPNEVAGPLTAMLARLLFQYKLYQTADEREKDPILLVCEEAHRYVPDRGEAQYASAQTAVRRVAREGRKYGLGLMLVSQRPADIESTVISQCGTWLVLRLTNHSDQQHVARFLPDGLAGMVRTLPNLAQQEAIFVGEGASLPSRVRIKDLAKEKLPRSQSVKFAKGWHGEGLSAEELGRVAERMVG
ncbi:ATP-binding protein [Halomonas campisalis]|uniref:ATP-binding protein n=1 Tax=Billgrantia campisalis TaxID=74661 RepID=A0ABS9PAB9_9GAMM|nr:ATP-binding protein [Halomonas campisalis]MCG6658586.1 ATP-binding protein [Halomonas campisalis]MDR5863448.1 ATP-binding protein [Halomonas campisalis]